jgi:hypothetical protein
LKGGISISSHWPKENKFKEGCYGWLSCVKGKGLMIWRGVLARGGVRLRRKRKCYDETKFFFLEIVFELFVLN